MGLSTQWKKLDNSKSHNNLQPQFLVQGTSNKWSFTVSIFKHFCRDIYIYIYIYPGSQWGWQAVFCQVICLHILIIKPTRRTNSQIYFRNRTPHVLDSISVHQQEFSTVHAAIGTGHTGYADRLLARSSWYHYQAVSITCMTYTYCCVYSTLLMTDRETFRNMWSSIPKINLRN